MIQLSPEKQKAALDGYRVFFNAFVKDEPRNFIEYENFAKKFFMNPWAPEDPYILRYDKEGEPIAMIWFMNMPMLAAGKKMIAIHGADLASTQSGRGLVALNVMLESQQYLADKGIPFRFGAPTEYAFSVAEKMGYKKVGRFVQYALNLIDFTNEMAPLFDPDGSMHSDSISGRNYALDFWRRAFCAMAGIDVSELSGITISISESDPFEQADFDSMNVADDLIKVERSKKYFDWRIGQLEGRNITYFRALRNGIPAGYMILDIKPGETRVADWDVYGDDSEKLAALCALASACAQYAMDREPFFTVSHLNPGLGEDKLFEKLGFTQVKDPEGNPVTSLLCIMPSKGCDVDEIFYDFSKWKLREVDRDYFMNCNPRV